SDVSNGSGIRMHQLRPGGSGVGAVGNTTQHVAIGHASSCEVAVIGGDQVVGKQYAVEVVSSRASAFCFFFILWPQLALNLTTHALQCTRGNNSFWRDRKSTRLKLQSRF